MTQATALSAFRIRSSGVGEGCGRSIRRKYLDHVVIFGERHLRHLLNAH